MRGSKEAITMTEDKDKGIKKILKNFFGKKDKKERDKSTEGVSKKTKDLTIERSTKEKDYTENISRKETKNVISAENVVDTILKNFDKLHLEKKEEKNREAKYSDEEDAFTVKVFDEERRSERTDSQSSQDSGFAQGDEDDEFDKKSEHTAKVFDEKLATTQESDKFKETKIKAPMIFYIEAEQQTKEKETENYDVTAAFDKLQLGEKETEDRDEEGKKKKKCQVVSLKRAPIPRRRKEHGVHPYDHELNFRQINQVNPKTFSGGQVIVNANLTASQFAKLNDTNQAIEEEQAIKEFSEELASVGVTFNGPQPELDLIQQVIDAESSLDTSEVENFLTDFYKNPDDINFNLQSFVQSQIQISNLEPEPENAIDEFYNANHCDEIAAQINSLDTLLDFENEHNTILDENLQFKNEKEQLMYPNYPTPSSVEYSPPYSNNLSPLSNNNSNNLTTSPYSSPFSIGNSTDYSLSPSLEKQQDITPLEENLSEHEDIDKKEKSMTLKQFKDMQKSIAGSFSKKECCQAERKPCIEYFKQYLLKLGVEERRHLCLKVSSLDIKMAFGVLQNILWSLSQGDSTLHEKQMALFALVCEKAVSQLPSLFLGDEGLSLLKSAVLRCYKRPLLTRYLVQCVRAAVRTEPNTRQYVFSEVDGNGDNLPLACARGGDVFADVLYELTNCEHQPPLFNLYHPNTEGYTAVHLACRLHAPPSPRLHVVHVLLEHAGCDIWREDMLGGDTCVHLAVNSPTCDLNLILLLFRHLDRKLWKKLAHATNRGSVTPLELARIAAKSTTRPNYPQEVLGFLKKCR